MLPGESFFNSFTLKERITGNELTNHISVNFLELQKLLDVHKENFLEAFGYFLNNEGNDTNLEKDEKLKNIILDDPILKEAHEKYLRFTGDPKLREAYENRLKVLRDKATLLDEAETRGEQRGLKQGIISTAQKLKEEGVSVSVIVKCTGLSEEEIERL